MTYAQALLEAVGEPDNINTVDVAALPIVVGWLAADVATRVTIVDALATALDGMRADPEVWEDIRPCAAYGRIEFTQMVALGKAIDRLIRARLPLTEATLTKLAHVVVERADFSELRLTAQLEHYAKTQPVGPTLRAAMQAIAEHFAWNPKLVARIAWVAAEAQPARVQAKPR